MRERAGFNEVAPSGSPAVPVTGEQSRSAEPSVPLIDADDLTFGIVFDATTGILIQGKTVSPEAWEGYDEKFSFGKSAQMKSPVQELQDQLVESYARLSFDSRAPFSKKTC
jgi:hypothetical protein